MLACALRDDAMIDFLLAQGSDLSACDKNGESCLYYLFHTLHLVLPKRFTAFR